jgi:regulator of protease activity HflC (stomatin/prohibitin superfamily)
MEKQMRAEREKRAAILQSEGERDAKINVAEGEKQAFIKNSEARMLAQINNAKGEAEAILSVAEATAEGLRVLSQQLQTDGGRRAMEMRIAEQYIPEFGKIAQMGNTIVLPANLTELGSILTLARNLIREPEQVYVAQQPATGKQS